MKFPETYESKGSPQWATLTPHRRPEFKLHASLGLAHSAIADKKPSQEVALYHLEVIDGTPVWKKVWEYVYPEVCDWCQQKIENPRHYGGMYNTPWDYKGIKKDAPVICDKCYAQEREDYVKERQRASQIAQLKALRELYPEE